MTEDETFIRAIVDAPGDDLPRRVYADWLDDRGDPRGSYLRAERETVAIGDIGRLRGPAVGLDPVWVARVSRPPVGVCCEHLRIWSTGPLATADDVSAAETAVGGVLPPAFRAFLLNYNGGVPSARFFHNPARRGAELGVIEKFYAISVGRRAPDTDRPVSSPRTSEVDLAVVADTLYNGPHPPLGPRAFAPLAADEVPYMNLIGLSGVRAGRIYWHNYYSLQRSNTPRKVADSLPEFLLSLRKTPELN